MSTLVIMPLWIKCLSIHLYLLLSPKVVQIIGPMTQSAIARLLCSQKEGQMEKSKHINTKPEISCSYHQFQDFCIICFLS